MSSSEDVGSPTSPFFGPRAQTVNDFVLPTPPLANFLNSNLRIISIDELGEEHEDCIICKKRMCDSIRTSTSSTEIHRPILHTPAPSPEPAYQNTADVSSPSPSIPLSLSSAGSDNDEDHCPNRVTCEVAVRITRPGCGHIFGSRCLFVWLQIGSFKCPICRTLWFRSRDRSLSDFVLQESWPRKMRMEFEFGIGRVVQRRPVTSRN
jgi:hypothetical protein